MRIYSETLRYEDVTSEKTLALLGSYGLELVLAVRPWQLGELPSVAKAILDAKIPLSIWPMLSDEQGRWASTRNATAFARLMRDVFRALDDGGARPGEMLFDLEPPFSGARALAHGDAHFLRPRNAWGARHRDDAFEAAENELAAVVTALHAHGLGTSSAVWPLVALDGRDARVWQSLLGTPIDALATERVSVMMYTTILEGWSRGAIRRPDALALLAAACARTAKRWSGRGGISVGCVGTGAFEDEPIYRGPRDLAEDVAIVRAEGITDITLFDLGGVLARPPAEAWLDAFVKPSSAPVIPASKRVAAARRLARVATWALSRAERMF